MSAVIRALSVAGCLLLAGPAIADVTIEQKINVEAGGALSMAAMQGTTVTRIAADKSRTDSNLEFKSGLLRTFAGGAGKTTDIVRLDEELIINLDHKHKRYTEITFAEMRKRSEEALQQFREMQEADDAGQATATDLPVEEQDCEWSDAVVTVESSGEKQKIARQKAEKMLITATQSCRNPDTGKVCELTWTLEQWLAPKVPGGDEVQAFWQRYAEKLGLGDTVGQVNVTGMAQIFSQYQQGWDEIRHKVGEAEGYPVKTVMQLEIGGAECTTAAGQPISNESVFGDAMADAAGSAAAESVGDAAGGAVGGAIAKSLFSVFGKKKKPKPVAAAEPQTGSVRLFRVTTETTAIKSKKVSADQFEVPAGFTLVE